MRARLAYRSSLAVACVCALVNVVVLVRVWRLASSPVSYNVRVIEPQPLPSFPTPPGQLSPDSPTNGVDIVSRGSTFERKPEQLAVIPYSVALVDGVRVLCMNGRYYRSGDACAFGVVDFIFPERVYVRSGDYISNVTYSKYGLEGNNGSSALSD